MDEIQEELDHQDFMDYVKHLEEQIHWALINKPLAVVQPALWDIDKYGNEPIFTDMVFDYLIAEDDAK